MKGSSRMHQQTPHQLLRMTLTQPIPGRMPVFSCSDWANVPLEQGVLIKRTCSSDCNCSPSLTSKELIVNPRWLMGTGERLASVTLSITIHQLFLSSPASVPVTPCLQPVEMWMSVTLERGLTVTIHPRTSFTVLLSQVLSLRNLLWKKKKED